MNKTAILTFFLGALTIIATIFGPTINEKFFPKQNFSYEIDNYIELRSLEIFELKISNSEKRLKETFLLKFQRAKTLKNSKI